MVIRNMARLVIPGDKYNANSYNTYDLLFQSYTTKDGVTDYIRETGYTYHRGSNYKCGISYGISVFLTPLTKNILTSLKKDIELIHKDKKLLVNSVCISNIFEYFNSLFNFNENKGDKGTNSFHMVKDLKYIDAIYKYFTEGIIVKIEEFTVDNIFEFYDVCEFLLPADKVKKYIKQLILKHISCNTADWDYETLSKISKKVFNNYLDVELLMIYKKYLKKEISISELRNICKNLIRDTFKELEYVTDPYS